MNTLDSDFFDLLVKLYEEAAVYANAPQHLRKLIVDSKIETAKETALSLGINSSLVEKAMKAAKLAAEA